MKRSEIEKDLILMSKVKRRYFSRPTDRKEVFDVSEQEVMSTSISLQKKLQQNSVNYSHLCRNNSGVAK